jgi:long-chain acyl-CoA synthetase
MIAKRLFDFVTIQAEENPIDKSLSYKYNGAWRHFSSKEFKEQVDLFSRAFIASGLQPGDKVALVSNNRPEWNFCDNGMMQVGLVNVPIYPTSSKNDFEFILNNCEAKLIFVSDEIIFNKINEIKGNIPSLQDIYSFDQVEGCKHVKEFLEKGKETSIEVIEPISQKIKGEDLATIIYTSGTTGNPKGVMLSHNNIIFNVNNVNDLPIYKESRTLSFLPLCHIFERVVTYVYFHNSVEVYYAESLEKLKENIAEVKPHFFSCVPRLLEKIYEGLIAKGQEFSGIKKMLYYWAIDVANKYRGNKGLSFYIVDKLIFSKWREALGGNIDSIVTGAAALQPRLGYFFEAIGIRIREGYGLTETSPVISYNRFSKEGSQFGTVGRILPNTEVKFEHREGMNADEGEILVKGDNVMMGYYKNEIATNESIKDGWFYTGDIGKLIDGKFLKITDRAKELFKTSGGKYVAPQVIENKVKESKYIEQIAVIGNHRKFVSALMHPSKINFEKWAQIKGLSIDFTSDEWVNNEWVNKKIDKILAEYNKEFNHVEQIKKFKLLAKEWTIEGGELTPTLKIKRKIIDSKYSETIETLYC